MANTVLVQAPAGVTQITGVPTGQTYVPDSNGQFYCDPNDLRNLLAVGFLICVNRVRTYATGQAVAVANAALLFASAALSNGTKAVAAQPDVGRQVAAVVNPGASAITAGALALTYLANDGTTQTDTFSLVTPLSTNLTMSTSKGVLHMQSQIVTGLTGGTSPGIQIGTNGVLALPLDAGSEGVTLLKENDSAGDVALGTLGSNGLVTPTTALNGTLTFQWVYKFTSPG